MKNIVDTKFVSDLFGNLDHYQLTYAFNGEFTTSLTEQILSLVETSMEVESESSKTKKKVYFIMVESLQNITRHHVKKESNSLKDDYFSIHKTNLGYLVTSGNIIENNNIASITNKIEKLNAMNTDELRQYHQEMLSSTEFSEKGGAGLGLLEMLRKSGNKLVYEFIKINEEVSYFYFQSNVALNTPETEVHASGSKDTLILAKNIHNTLLENNLKTVFHGQFGHDNVKGLLAMTENKVASIENTKNRKAIISVMIEMLQNICFHADGKKDYKGEGPGMFMISDSSNGLALTTVNYIENSKIDGLIENIDKINSMNRDEAKSHFLEKLMADDENRKHGGGLGLLDIRIKSNNKISVSTQNSNQELSYLILTAKVALD